VKVGRDRNAVKNFLVMKTGEVVLIDFTAGLRNT